MAIRKSGSCFPDTLHHLGYTWLIHGAKKSPCPNPSCKSVWEAHTRKEGCSAPPQDPHRASQHIPSLLLLESLTALMRFAFVYSNAFYCALQVNNIKWLIITFQ